MGRAKTEKFPIFAGFSLDPKTNKMSAGYIIGISIKPADFGLTGSEDNATMAAAVVKSLEAQGAAEATARAEAAEQRAEAVVADAQAAAHFCRSVAHLLASPGAEAEAVQHLRADDLPHLFDCLRERLAEQRAEALAAEVARLRAVIDDAVAELPVWPDGAYQTPAERDVSGVRARLLAALAEAQPAEAPNG